MKLNHHLKVVLYNYIKYLPAVYFCVNVGPTLQLNTYIIRLLRFWVRINIDFRDLTTHNHATLKVVKAMVLEMISKRWRFSIMVSVVDNAYYCNCHFFLENSILSDWLLHIYKYHEIMFFVFVKISKLKCNHNYNSEVNLKISWKSNEKSIKNYAKH